MWPNINGEINSKTISENDYGYLWIHFDFYQLKIRFLFDCFLSWPMEHREGLKLLNSLTFDPGNEYYCRIRDHFVQRVACEAEYHLNIFYLNPLRNRNWP